MDKAGIIGSAVVGQTRARGFRSHGHEVRIGSRTPSKLAGFSAGKLVIDTTNPISDKPPVEGVVQFFTGPDRSLLLEQFGWEAADMGTAVAGRAIEPLCQLWCIAGFLRNSWTHAFKVLWS